MADTGESFPRREYLLAAGAGSIAVLSGTAGCLGLGDDEQQSESSDETDENNSENGSDNGTEGTENESEDEDATDEEDVDDESDGSILEDEESDENDSENESEATENESEDDEAGDGDTENGTANETQDTETPEEPQEDADNETDRNESEADAAKNESEDGASETDSEGDHEGSGTEDPDEGEGRSFEQYAIDELSYHVDYPADWEVDESNDGYVQILNSDETAWIWIETEEARLTLEQEVRNYRETFEPEPSAEIHADDSVTLSSGEDGHRFVIEMADRETNQLIAHELFAHANGIQFLTSVMFSRSEYNEDYAQLAEKILASVALD
ncbi:hypothetical protein [Saliphagus sp. LR7]|uniref:hypothetical protein n=1 Tax=Saliphagus sp. LR7 TaxID=2282654 RepID=UPI00130080C8|nr:hypothetical protein [Saliphagus sp. LR7]